MKDNNNCLQNRGLDQYFRAVDRRISHLFSGLYDTDVRIGGKLLRFHFQTKEQKNYADILYTGAVCPRGQNRPDAEFFFWREDLSPYLSADRRDGGVWSVCDEAGFLKIVPSNSMIGGDYHRGRYYSCLEEEAGRADPSLMENTLGIVFRWAFHCDLMLLHGAAVGTGGRGVLLGGRGGAGKSTLAAACLLRGMDFAGDDYVLVSRKGPFTAIPLFHTLKLCSDTEEMLSPGLPLLYTEEPSGKRLLDASGLTNCPALNISCILFPRLSEGGRARIQKAPPGKALAQIVHSCMTQFGFTRELPLIKEMLDRLGKLPVYEMYLSRDMEENVLCLEAFLKSGL